MSLKNGAYATVWETRRNQFGSIDARMSTSRKADDGTYKTDWSGWVRLWKDCEGIANLPSRTRIKIGDFAVTNTYDKESKKEYTNYTLFSYELPDSSRSTSVNTTKSSVAQPINNADDDLPF